MNSGLSSPYLLRRVEGGFIGAFFRLGLRPFWLAIVFTSNIAWVDANRLFWQYVLMDRGASPSLCAAPTTPVGSTTPASHDNAQSISCICTSSIPWSVLRYTPSMEKLRAPVAFFCGTKPWSAPCSPPHVITIRASVPFCTAPILRSVL